MPKADREFIGRIRQALPIRVVIDSCVFPCTAQWLVPLTDAASSGYLELYWSPLIIAESNRILTWLWLKRHGGDFSSKSWEDCSKSAKQMFSRLTRVFRVIDDCPSHGELWQNPRDEWDVPIWTAAIRCEAALVVTENLVDGPPANSEGLRKHESVAFIYPENLLALLGNFTDWIEAADLPEIIPQSADDPVEGDVLGDNRQLLQHILSRVQGPGSADANSP